MLADQLQSIEDKWSVKLPNRFCSMPAMKPLVKPDPLTFGFVAV
jgi:hypothetical protein